MIKEDRVDAQSLRMLRRCGRAYRFGRTALAWPFARWLRYAEPSMPGLPDSFIVIANHTMDMDFFFLMRAFPQPMSFVAGETLFQVPILRWLLTRFHDPVIISKGGTDMRAVLSILHRLRGGERICLFAEGNTCFDGLTGPFPEGTGQLVRASGVSLVTFRVRGGYLSGPRWGRGHRRGRVLGELVQVYSPEQLKAMAPEEINAVIRQDIFVDAWADQEAQPVAYRSRRRAEGLEHALYLCPGCEEIGSLKGEGARLRCLSCGFETVYSPEGFFDERSPHRHVHSWTAWQRSWLRGRLEEQPGFGLSDQGEALRLVQDDHSLTPVAAGQLRLDAGGIRIGDFSLPLARIAALPIFRKNRLMLADRQGNYYDFAPKKGRSALKYRDLFEILSKED